MSTSKQAWERVEGIIVAPQLDPQAVSDYIAKTKAVATIDWFDATPNLLGLTLAAENGRLATVNAENQIAPHIAIEDFALKLAQTFKADVMIGDVQADAMEEDAKVTHGEETEDEHFTAIEFTQTPASSVPLLAALHDVDIATMELSEDQRVIIYESDNPRNLLLGGEPAVVIVYSDGELKIRLQREETDEDETMPMFNWSMRTRTVAGAHKDDAVEQQAQDLVGAKTDLIEIGQAIPSADVEALLATVGKKGNDLCRSVVTALGLPPEVALVLQGYAPLRDLPGADFNDPRGIANAIGRSVDRMLNEPESRARSFWDGYNDVVTEKPWMVYGASAAEAVTGSLAIANFARKNKTERNWLTKLGLGIGIVLLIDSVAELSLAKYVSLRDNRKQH
ncbi:hypothetical protein QS713_02965 [Gleimia hominis]|uniref:Uncharacterized protein n=1 Tax=Gleimia hominis TaxID=595468 RepID=A0ABU3I9H4_9ACTO|nr:hypothetical protein [Gleimia hominis]MDT3767027.1 hypothetical protein [Gleimia hominis]